MIYFTIFNNPQDRIDVGDGQNIVVITPKKLKFLAFLAVVIAASGVIGVKLGVAASVLREMVMDWIFEVLNISHPLIVASLSICAAVASIPLIGRWVHWTVERTLEQWQR